MPLVRRPSSWFVRLCVKSERFVTSGRYRLWDRFRAAPWQRIVRLGLVPVTMGVVIVSGAVMARAADTGWRAVAVTIAAAAIVLGTRLNPLWMLFAGGALGGLGLL